MNLRKIVGALKREKTAPKVKTNVTITTPVYFNRHLGSDFLIIVTGPSITAYQQQIQAFIDANQPIVMAGNFIDHMFVPHYHAFINRARFCTYAHTVDPQSTALLSPYFTDQSIKQHFGRPYEELMFERIYASRQGRFAIDDGIIHTESATIGVVLLYAAISMGCKDIYVAGMDGYSLSKKVHYYSETDDKDLDALLEQQRIMTMQLDQVAHYLHQHRNGTLRIITPTAYDKHQVAIETLYKKER